LTGGALFAICCIATVVLKERSMMRTLAFTAVLAAFAAVPASAVVVSDIVQSPTSFFVPSEGLKLTAPYIRNGSQDWGWAHNPIAIPITSATLSISAFDVDFAEGERDAIEALDNGVWTLVGFLEGANETWAFTNFNLTSNFFDDIAGGLQVRIDIARDTGEAGADREWRVSLAKSVLTVPAGRPFVGPGPVPEPASWAMLIAGFGLVGAVARRRRMAVSA
jgi:hypothetical protein